LKQAWENDIMMFRVLAGLASTALMLGAAQAQSVSYKINMAGLDVGSATMTAEDGGKSYSFQLSGTYSVLVARGSFSVAASGTRNASKLVPRQYGMNINSDRPEQTTIEFRKGAATTISINPVPSAGENNGRVPLTKAHLRNVLDPASALLALAMEKGAQDEGNLCNGVEVFTGMVRARLSFSPANETPLQVLCAVNLQAIAGHKNNENLKRLTSSGKLRVGFSRKLDGNLRFPYSVSVPLRWGLLTLTRKG
jgi:hypothetical protein